MSNGLPMVR